MKFIPKKSIMLWFFAWNLASNLQASDICPQLLPLIDPDFSAAKMTQEEIKKLFAHQTTYGGWAIQGKNYVLIPSSMRNYNLDISVDNDGLVVGNQTLNCSVPIGWELETYDTISPQTPKNFWNSQGISAPNADPFVRGWTAVAGLAVNHIEYGKNHAAIAWQLNLKQQDESTLEQEIKQNFTYIKNLKIKRKQITTNDAHNSVIAMQFAAQDSFPWLIRHPTVATDRISFPFTANSPDTDSVQDPFVFSKNANLLSPLSMSIVQPTSFVSWEYSSRYCRNGTCGQDARWNYVADVISAAKAHEGLGATIIYQLQNGQAAVGEYWFAPQSGFDVKRFRIYDSLYEIDRPWLLNFREKN